MGEVEGKFHVDVGLPRTIPTANPHYLSNAVAAGSYQARHHQVDSVDGGVDNNEPKIVEHPIYDES